MSHLIKSMEQLGSNPALKYEVRMNCLDTLINLGVDKQLSAALTFNNAQETIRLIKTREIMFLYISVPLGLSNNANQANITVNSHVFNKQQMIMSKVA